MKPSYALTATCPLVRERLVMGPSEESNLFAPSYVR